MGSVGLAPYTDDDDATTTWPTSWRRTPSSTWSVPVALAWCEAIGSSSERGTDGRAPRCTTDGRAGEHVVEHVGVDEVAVDQAGVDAVEVGGEAASTGRRAPRPRRRPAAEQRAAEVGADEPGSAGDDDLHAHGLQVVRTPSITRSWSASVSVLPLGRHSPVREDPRRRAVEPARAVGEHRLEVHRLPRRAGPRCRAPRGARGARSGVQPAAAASTVQAGEPAVGPARRAPRA